MYFSYQEFLLTHGVKIAGILAGSYLLYQLLTFVKKRIIHAILAKRAKDDKFPDRRIHTISNVIMRTGMGVISLIVLLMILKELGLDPSPILASAGIFGLAVSLGAQSYMKDVIAGMIILMENQYCEGDFVKLDESEGEVLQITLRKTILTNDKGVLRHIPNGQIKIVSVLPSPRSKRA